jgi:hypothetical protein
MTRSEKCERTYLTDIREARKYLSNDLAAISPTAQRAATAGNSVKESIKPVLAAIDQVKFEITQGGASKSSEIDVDQK